MKRYLKAELGLTAFFFLVLLFFPPARIPFNGSITGNVVLESKEDVQIGIQEILRDPIFGAVGDGAKMCVQVRQNPEEYYSFKVRKRAGFYEVRPSNVYCDGQNVEELVFNFASYKDFAEFRNTQTIDYFRQDNIEQKFEIWPSVTMESGGLMKCNAEFDKYCGFLAEQFTNSERKRIGITCCDAAFEKPGSAFMRFLNEYWWLAALLTVVLVLGTGATIILTRGEKETDADQEGIIVYIERLKQVGYPEMKIKEALLGAGWDAAAVNGAFDAIRNRDLTSLTDRFTKL